MRLATEAGSAAPSAVRRPSRPQVTPVVACRQERSGKSPLSEALREARICPSQALEVFLADHVRRRPRVDNKFSVLRFKS